MTTFAEALANLPNSHPAGQWAIAHLTTQLIEVPLYFALLFRFFRKWWLALPLAVFVNALTHPALWYLFPFWTADGSWLLPLLPARLHENADYYCWLFIAECCVVVVEGHVIAAALVLRGKEKYQGAPFAVSYGMFAAFIANVPSTLAGLLL